jgi:hypothetical protein
MRHLSYAIGLGVLLLAAPIAAERTEAAPAPALDLVGEAGGDMLRLADWSGRDDDRDDDWKDRDDDDRDGDGRRRHHRHRDYGHQWGPPQHGGGVPYFAARPLAPWVVEHRLRRQHFQPIGRLTLRHGVYLVPALDPRGRRVVLVIDPITAVILGRQRHW